jgi:CYTH domain-containing protein
MVGDRKYALVERERRFLLAGVPSEPPVRVVEIVDRYLDRSRIRLRAATTVEGESRGTTQYKLTQKLPAADGGPGLITNLYLDADEHRLFDALPGALLRKTRLSIPPFGVDDFGGALEGLVLAEAEFPSDEEMRTLVPPVWVVAEVTQDAAFGGGRLARSSRYELRRALAAYGVELPPSGRRET